jgi:hypothetical protein
LARGQQQLLQRRSLASQALPERLLLLLGMHRSGTSALAGLLQSQGFQAPLDVPPADANNPSGYWEPQRIVACHTALMEQLRTSWDDPLLVEDAFAGDRLPPALEKLEQALAQAFPPAGLASGAVALVKDPRQCRLQPLWNALLDAHQIEAAAVLIVREPLAVVRSLQRRDHLPVNRALLLWLQYTLEAERHTRQLPRLLLSYRQLLAHREYIGQVLYGSAMMGSVTVFVTSAPYVAIEVYGVKPSTYGLLFILPALASFSGFFFTSRMAGRLGAERMMRMGTTLTCLGGFALLTGHLLGLEHPLAIMVPGMLVCAANALSAPNSTASAIRASPNVAGAASGLLGFTQLLVGAIATQLVAFAAHGSATPLVVAIVCLNLAAALLLRANSRLSASARSPI